MKKRKMFSMLGVMALAGCVGLSSCSGSDDFVEEPTPEVVPEEEEVNPTYNAETNEVAVEFVLNVATSPQQFTRQSSTTVQRNSNFRGMQDAKLIGLSTGNSGWLAPFDGSATSGFGVNKTFDLGTLYGSSAVNNSGTNNSTSSSRRVLELAMPLTTDAMLVYARAIPSGDPIVDGKVTMTVDPNPENTTFELNSRLGDRDTEYDQTCALAIKILNRIIGSEVGETDTEERNGYTNVAPLPALTWKQLGTTADFSTLKPLEEILANAYKNLTTIASGEKRAGSSSAISSIAYYLYNTADHVYNATATSDAELNAQRLAYVITRRISNYFEKYTESETATAFLSIEKIKNNMKESTGMTSEAFDAAYGKVQHGDLKAFPASFGLPLGVAQLDYTDSEGFKHKDPAASLLQSGTLSEANYMYPAELMYFDNSALRINSNTVAASAYPDGYSNWNNESKWSDWTTGAVASSTRSVAVKNNIKYGVAMLHTKVELDGSSFYDNRDAITHEGNQTLDAGDVGKFELVGVLVGNQCNSLTWNYLSNSTAAGAWNYVVYDNNIDDGTIPAENYTLLFDNYIPNADDSQTSEVYVALEFKNNGDDFYGVGNMIRTGGTFYLVGRLTLANATNTVSWPTTYAIPPYETDGNSKEISRVFIQDYMTTATFKINSTSLQKAFVTVPDLRSSQTSLGLSVDLNWQTGLNFETVLGE